MSRINKKGKIILSIIAFLLITPLTIFYVLDGAGVFDTRSRAGETGAIPEQFAKADLNGDKKISIADFSIWLSSFRDFKKNSSSFSAMSDLDSDKAIGVNDFGMWLAMWRGYKAYGNPVVPPVAFVLVENVGTGVDGDITIAASTNINTVNKISGRSCANGGDAVNFNIVSFSADGKEATLSSTPSTGCLNVGDDVLVINLQGTATASVNVGNYEILKIGNVSANKVTFEAAKKRFYGNSANDDSNIGIEGNNQKVMLQRVPNYKNVTVNASRNFFPSAWDGLKGGVIFFKASGEVNVKGIIHANASGYRGGAKGVGTESGTQGESIKGLGTVNTIANEGAGGGGYKYGGSGNGGDGGGGGSYGTLGTAGVLWGVGTAGVNGTIYGVADLSKLFLGSGGGGGGSYGGGGGNGGNGGGIVYISAKNITVFDKLNSNAAAGIKKSNNSSGGGGGGAGGSIKVYGESVNIGVSKTTVSGGAGGASIGTGGIGGSGRIAVYYKSVVIGTTIPVFFSRQVQ